MLDDMAITTSWDANTMHSGGNYNIIVFFIIVFSVLVLTYIPLGLIEKKKKSILFLRRKKKSIFNFSVMMNLKTLTNVR